MMTRIFGLVVSLFFAQNALACPYCVGNSQGGQDQNTSLILAIFIVAIYIPYIVIYRLIKKQRAYSMMMDEENERTGSTNS